MSKYFENESNGDSIFRDDFAFNRNKLLHSPIREERVEETPLDYVKEETPY